MDHTSICPTPLESSDLEGGLARQGMPYQVVKILRHPHAVLSTPCLGRVSFGKVGQDYRMA